MTPAELIRFAFETYPREVVVAKARITGSSMGSKPGGRLRRLPAIKIAVPRERIKEIRRGDWEIVLVAVPKHVAERAKSRVVLPGEVVK